MSGLATDVQITACWVPSFFFVLGQLHAWMSSLCVPQVVLLCRLIRELRNQPQWKWWRPRPPAWPTTPPASYLPPRWRSLPWRERNRWADRTNSNIETWTCLRHQDSKNHFLLPPWIAHIVNQPVAGLPMCSPVLSCCSVMSTASLCWCLMSIVLAFKRCLVWMITFFGASLCFAF